MSHETALQLVRFLGELVHLQRQQMLYVVFYGGEPLLNRVAIKAIVEEIETSTAFADCEVLFRLITNGSLLNTQDVRYFRAHNIIPSISVDGPSEVNRDIRRRTSKVAPTAEHRAASLLNKFGVPYELSITVSGQNVDSFQEHLDKALAEFVPHSVRINVPEAYEGLGPREFLSVCQTLGDMWFSAIQTLHAHRIRCSNAGLQSFWYKAPRYFPCAAAGRRLAVTCRGHLGPCESFASRDEHLIGTIWEEPARLVSSTTHPWFHRSGYKIRECCECIALGMCAGGCAYNAQLLTGSFNSPDISICPLAKSTVRKLLFEEMKLLTKERHEIRIKSLRTTRRTQIT